MEEKVLRPGVKGYQEDVVTKDKLAQNVGSGKVKVLATVCMIALMEKTCLLSVEPWLAEGQGTVGTRVDVSHCSATPEGMKFRVESELIEVDRRRLVFKVEAYDECGLIGEGTHERFIIDNKRFIEKTESKNINAL